MLSQNKKNHPTQPGFAPQTKDYAQIFATRKWAILPLHYPQPNGNCSCKSHDCQSHSKHPLTKKGCKDASTSFETIRTWWNTWPLANIGIATGSISNLYVLDIDAKSGGLESLQKLEQQVEKLPSSHIVETGGGGLHYYFSAPDLKLRNRTNILSGIDFRGENGYVVAPPSMHASGKQYKWRSNPFKNKTPLPSMPNWLIDLISHEPLKLEKSINSFGEGSRNSTLTSIGGLLRRHGLNSEIISTILQTTNSTACVPPLTSQEVDKISQSVSRYSPKPNLKIANNSWNEPKQISEIKHEVPQLCPELLPHSMRPWLSDITERMQVPLEFVAIPAMIALSSILWSKSMYQTQIKR